MPLGGWYAIVSGGGSKRVAIDRIGDVARLGALGAWRVSQGIYRFDPALYGALPSTPVDGELPCEVLYRLPEWCVFRLNEIGAVAGPGYSRSELQLDPTFCHHWLLRCYNGR